MQTFFINDEILYDGTQLKSHWPLEKCGLFGDCIVSFIGGADVPIQNMVDLADVKDNAPIFSKKMLHFIIEHFDLDLKLAVARQRILTAIAVDGLRKYPEAKNIYRKGDDIFDGGKKVSVSIATVSPVSTLIHFAMNIETDGTPIPTSGLKNFEIDAKNLAREIMNQYKAEVESMELARTKVRAVK